MTSSELQHLMVNALVRKLGGSQRRWRAVIGPVRLHDRATHPHCNWSVNPSGSPAENSAVEQLLDDVRLTYPVVAKG